MAYKEYIDRLIKPSKQCILNAIVDSDCDLPKIARHITEWETKLAVPLRLTQTEISDIKKVGRSDPTQPIIERKQVLIVWKGKAKAGATYENLLKACLEGGDTYTAEKICELIQNETGFDRHRKDIKESLSSGNRLVSIIMRRYELEKALKLLQKDHRETSGGAGQQDDNSANGKDEPADCVFLKVWNIAKAQTAKALKSLFEKVIKKPLDLIFKRRYKIRKNGDEKQTRWWIEVKGDKKGLQMLESKQHEISRQTGCHLEAKAC